MLKLFSVVLGGRAQGCNIELHDVVFVTAESIEKAYPSLRQKWFGLAKRLHLDAYIELTHADGYDIFLSKEKSKDKKKLYFVNFGAYKPDYFGEVHETDFYVGTAKTEVLARAKQHLCVDGIEPHCDDNISIDDVISFDEVDEYYLHFIPAEKRKLQIVTKYHRLDVVA